MTANDFRARGIRWSLAGGGLRATGHEATDETRAALRDEIAERAKRIGDAASSQGCAFAAVRLAGPTKRHGQCEVCGDERDAHRGGMCMLCVAAVRALVRGQR